MWSRNRLNLWVKMVLLPWMFLLFGCSTLPLGLPSQKCQPSTDLAQPKHLRRLPEAAIPNDEFYKLFLEERSDHAVDVRDYNSLFKLCVDNKLPPEAFKVFSD